MVIECYLFIYFLVKDGNGVVGDGFGPAVWLGDFREERE